MTTARRLQEIREQQQVRRRATRLWATDLGGRSSLPMPLRRGRTLGGVQQPSIGTVNDLGEMTCYHHPGPLTVVLSDPYPVLYGGAPFLKFAFASEPTTGVELQLWINGAPIETSWIVTANGDEHAAEYVAAPGDLTALEIIDADDAEGMVAPCEFRSALQP